MGTTLILFGAKYLIFVILLIAVVWFLRAPRATKNDVVIDGLLFAVIALVLARVAGMLYVDPRPFVTDHVVPLLTHVADNGFPSDHTLLGAVIGLTLWHFSRRIGLLLLLLTALVGVSRVMAHVHHAIDIVGSFGIAMLAALLVFHVIMPMVKKTRVVKKRPTP